jgi:hypothetical protein
MPRFSDAARQKMIENGRKKGYGDITSREMGAMGGSTTRNLVNISKAVLGGNPDAVADLQPDDVFIRKDNDAKPLDLDLPAGSEAEQAQEQTTAPEAQTRRGVTGRARSRANA